jgi:peptide/nickel transport system permease protein
MTTSHSTSSAIEPAPGRGRRGQARSWYRRLLVCLARYVLLLYAIVTLVFLIPRVIPGGPIDNFGGTPAQLANIRSYYGLDHSLASQYGSYLTRLARGDLGRSFSVQGFSVAALIRTRLPWTILLTTTSLAVASSIGFLSGVTAAWRRRGHRDRLLVTVMTAVGSTPSYAMAILLSTTLAIAVPVFPLSGGRTPFATYTSILGQVADVAAHLVLPAVALAISLLSADFLLVRNSVVSSLGADYMVLARAKGLPDRILKYRHAGRNALLPFVTSLGLAASYVIGASLFVETVFGYPGMSTLVVRATETHDYPLMEGCFLVMAVAVLAVNLILELAYRRLDPRVAAE